jgi:hypothetical protein
MMRHYYEIHQRDHDGMVDVVSGDVVAGPFETRTFALRVAEGLPPTPARRRYFRRVEIREVLHAPT